MNPNCDKRDPVQITTSPARDDWFTPGRFTLLLGAFIVVMFPSILLGTKAFFFRDYGILGYPVAFYHRECFWNGEWPLWNPYNCSGIPHLAAWHTLTLYPLSLLYLLLPLPWSLGFFCLLHFVVAGLGMYQLVFQWTGRRSAAAFAGMAFAFNGLTISSLMAPNNMVALGWMPWVVWSVERGWREGRRRMLLAVFAATLQMLSGVPEIILFTWVLLAGLFLAERPPWRAWRCLGIMVILSAGLAAAQLLPFFQLLANSDRSQGYGNATWSMAPWGWLNFLVPLFHSYATELGVFFQPGQGWTSSYYVGVGTCALALLAVRQWREQRVLVVGTAALAGLALALGDHGFAYAGLRRVFPWMGFMRFPIKFVVLPVFALPLLAGLALARWNSGSEDDRKRRQTWGLIVTTILVAVIGLVVIFAANFPNPNEPWPAVWQSGLTRGLVLLLMMSILLKLQNVNERSRGQHTGLCLTLVVLAWVDAWTHTPPQNPTVNSTVCQPGIVAEKLALEPMLGRCRAWRDRDTEHLFYFRMLAKPEADYIGRRFGLYGNCNLLDRIPTPDGFYSLYLARQYEIAQTLYRAPTNRFPDGLANFLGITYVTNPTNLVAWRTRTNAQSWLTAGPRPVYLEPKAALTRIQAPDFDAQRLVYLPPEALPSISVTNRTEARILNQRFTPHRIVAEIEAKEPSLMVIAQSWYPCWRAYVDDRPVPLWQANYAFQALEVPAGQHEVKLVYRDNAFIVGGLISLLTLGGMGAAWFKWRKPDLPGAAAGESAATQS